MGCCWFAAFDNWYRIQFLAFPRFTFGQLNLLSGLSLLPVLIGLFAAAQAFEGVEKHNEIQVKQVKITKIGISGHEFIQILPHIIKSAFIGTFVGAVPGTGTDIAAFLSYGEAKRSSKHPTNSGQEESKELLLQNRAIMLV